MQAKEYDDNPLCRVCKKKLDNDELENNKISKMPALCREHNMWAREQIKKCLPLFQKMKL